jgi:hypothetical protein
MLASKIASLYLFRNASHLKLYATSVKAKARFGPGSNITLGCFCLGTSSLNFFFFSIDFFQKLLCCFCISKGIIFVSELYE